MGSARSRGVLLLAQDIGTSAVKTTIVDERGFVVDSVAAPLETRRPSPGQAEQDPEDWWLAVVTNTVSLLKRQSGVAERIGGIGVTGHMLGAVVVDGDGVPLRPALLHSDTRAHAESEWIDSAIGADPLYRLTGCVLEPRATLCKLRWLHTNEPEIMRNARAVFQSKDFIVRRLTGGPPTTDYSDASHGMLLEVGARRYAADLLKEAGVRADLMPDLHAGSDLAGTLSRAASAALGLTDGIPVVVGAGDGSCASVGAGAVSPGIAYCCVGSTAWMAVPGENPVVDPRKRVFNITSAGGETDDCFGTVQSAGATVSWALDAFGAPGFQELETALAETSPGANGLCFLPYLEGERSPIWDTQARGVIFGISQQHGRAHLLRAAAEGVAYALRSVLEAIREHTEVPSLRLVGGVFRSSGWSQLLADVTGLPVEPVDVAPEDATSLGAALTTAVGTGILESFADAAAVIGVRPPVVPQKGVEAAYERSYQLFQDLYPSLRPHFARGSI